MRHAHELLGGGGFGTHYSFETDKGVSSYNTHPDNGTASIVNVPDRGTLQAMTRQVFENNHWDLVQNIKSAGGGSWHAKPVAIPDKIGDPSLIKYVFLIIRENRTYRQSWAISPVAMATPRWRYSAQDHTERGQAREAIPSPRQFLRPQPPVG